MADAQDWTPTPGEYVVDRSGLVGVVRQVYAGSVYLASPHGGGLEWAVPPHELRTPTDSERPSWQQRCRPALRRCRASEPIPVPQLLTAVLGRQDLVSERDLATATGSVRCELGAWHPFVDHAAHVWDWDAVTDPALWLRWPVAGGGSRCEALGWCGAARDGADDDACILFDEHPPEHSWAVSDPLEDALRRRVAGARD
ncbi:hypothetical protein ABT160_39465 [Streptomyces sp. NPDC001941]|uniref:hypothetical protein n=1 Tax=Streptomyces sp. NPDC001941 TaxID=3154659 RepID=UPI003329CCEA